MYPCIINHNVPISHNSYCESWITYYISIMYPCIKNHNVPMNTLCGISWFPIHGCIMDLWYMSHANIFMIYDTWVHYDFWYMGTLWIYDILFMTHTYLYPGIKNHNVPMNTLLCGISWFLIHGCLCGFMIYVSC